MSFMRISCDGDGGDNDDGEEYTTRCGGVVTSSVRRRCYIKANHLKVRFIFNLLGRLK